MSIEYLGTPTPPLDQGTIDDLLNKLVCSAGMRMVRQTNSALGLANLNIGDRALETITISLSADKVYIGFHAATRDERDRLLQLVQRLLQDSGIECEFQEE